jgi:NADPH-dependent glutamate synthase beta subunit-like oxidoreductase/NAD-dependent dihydropyrimidine dehydrogenase PreA subunit
MLSAILMMGGLGLFVGVGLAVASKVFYVWVDPRVTAIEDALPGANCGGCGMPGCSANAQAIVDGKAAPNSCVAAGPEVAEEIAGILGVKVEAKEADIARPGCTYGMAEADTKFVYDGYPDCRAAALLGGGMKVCAIGCLGLGTCARACPFDAITMGPRGLPVVDEEKCTGCGTCERVCPKNIITLSSVTRRILKEYTTEDCTTPCQRACPAGIDICEYIRQITLGDFHRSVQVIKERNPFPTVIGRICPRPCEDACRRQLVDEPVAINFLKRFAADFERRSSERILPYKAPETGRRVAIIGGGVEGLSAAFFTTRLGHQATVYEGASQLGGLLRAAIARYRLPPEILDWDIEGILAMGVTARTGQVAGRDFNIATLLAEGYANVFVASGGWDSRQARTDFEGAASPIPGTHLLVDLLRDAPKVDTAPACAAEAVIVGGQQAAIEGARRCKQLGAERVTIALRETRPDSPWDEGQLAELENDGITIRFGAGVGRLFGEGPHLKFVELVDLHHNTSETATAGSLFIAAGRYPEYIFRRPPVAGEPEANTAATEPVEDEPLDAETLAWEGLAPYKKPAATNTEGLLAEVDPLSDFSGAIRAIAAGRRAAASIQQLIYDFKVYLPEKVLTPTSNIQTVDSVENVPCVPRQIMPLASPGEIANGREIEKGFSTETAQQEAGRCLQCGLICYRRTEAA